MTRLELSSIIIIILATCLCGCSAGGETGAPGAAVEGYLQSLVAQDVNAMIAFSCAEWEAKAREEYNAFAAVNLSLESLSCRQTGEDGEDALIACSGKIIANYGSEDLEIDVAERTYRVVQEGSEWRMCGFHQP